MATVLLVEDDEIVRQALIHELTDLGHAVHSVVRALDALREATDGHGYDMIVLDLGLPDLDGAEALKMLRAVTDTPVIIATARDDEREIVRLLRTGADDYVVKPFSGDQLDARIHAVLRRVRTNAPPDVLQVGGLRIDRDARRASLDGTPLRLTRLEFDLLAFLAARSGRVVRRREVLAEVWRQANGDDQTLDVHMSWLRRKLGETAARPRYLHTVRGVGVMLTAP
ncbi:response regulator transcription factor [Actinomadura sediminis]|uniref:Response regulator transcription factor n=1 Tax=Actinomadura sediminis TaxID=1038904 RepID=A0ABW3ETL7_9ACTN